MAVERKDSGDGGRERHVVDSAAVNAEGRYRDVVSAARKIARDKYGPDGRVVGVQLVLPGFELLVKEFDVCIGRCGVPGVSEAVTIVVNAGSGKE